MFLYALNPPRFNFFESGSFLNVKPIQESDISTHDADAATAHATTLLGKNLSNSVIAQNALHCALTKTEHLARAFRNKRIGIKRQAIFLGIAADVDNNRQRSFAIYFSLIPESQ